MSFTGSAKRIWRMAKKPQSMGGEALSPNVSPRRPHSGIPDGLGSTPWIADPSQHHPTAPSGVCWMLVKTLITRR